LWPFDVSVRELATRTEAGLGSAALAIASGAPGAFSITTGLSSVLVGVIVAVALLPPAVTLGLMLDRGEEGLDAGAGELLTINVVCINLASKVVFLIKGIRPQTWWEKEEAKRAIIRHVVVWLMILVWLICGWRVLRI
jgi:uncharacterized membrane protein